MGRLGKGAGSWLIPGGLCGAAGRPERPYANCLHSNRAASELRRSHPRKATTQLSPTRRSTPESYGLIASALTPTCA